MAKAKPPHGGGNKQPGAGAAPPRPGTNAWRRHFEAAETADQDELRGEYIRHLNESAAQAAALEPEPHPEQGT